MVDIEELKTTVADDIGLPTLFLLLLKFPEMMISDFFFVLKSVFTELFFNVPDLKKFLEILFSVYSDKQKINHLLEEVRVRFMSMSRNKQACKNLAILADCVGVERLLRVLPLCFFEAALDRNGNTIIQKLASPLLLRRLRGRFLNLSLDRFGHYVVQACMASANDCHSLFQVFSELEDHFHELFHVEYGSYTIQSLVRRFHALGIPLPTSMHRFLVDNYKLIRADEWGKYLVITVETLYSL